jgi:hypothetical protein
MAANQIKSVLSLALSRINQVAERRKHFGVFAQSGRIIWYLPRRQGCLYPRNFWQGQSGWAPLTGIIWFLYSSSSSGLCVCSRSLFHGGDSGGGSLDLFP